MKERPIIFSGPMVRAILDGQKTQTRRIVKFKLHPELPVTELYEHGPFITQPLNTQSWSATHEYCGGNIIEQGIKCPYGQQGDRLWVRETWAGHWGPPSDKSRIVTGVEVKQTNGELAIATKDNPLNLLYKADCEEMPLSHLNWTPSIHMFRWASRITLEVEAVGVERLQDISDLDAYEEGAEGPRPTYDGNEIGETGPPSFVHGFADIWDSIHGDGAWKEDPWVWVITFRRLTDAD